jgi:hypothetical protein
MRLDQLKPNIIVRGAIYPELIQVILVVPMCESVKLIGKGLKSGKVHEPILDAEQLATLDTTPDKEPFDGDQHKSRLGIEAHRLELAYGYDPYFSLSIARLDPLPYRPEAVYDYFIRPSHIRFLLAGDPRAGKTIMAGSTALAKDGLGCSPQQQQYPYFGNTKCGSTSDRCGTGWTGKSSTRPELW